MSRGPVYVLGGFQTDFARNYGREGLGLVDIFKDAVHPRQPTFKG